MGHPSITSAATPVSARSLSPQPAVIPRFSERFQACLQDVSLSGRRLRPTFLREHPMPASPSPVLPCRIALRQMCPGHQVPNFCLPSQLLGNVSNMFPLHSALRHPSHSFPFRMRAAPRCRRLRVRYQLPTTLVPAIQKRFSRIQPAHHHVLSACRVLFPHCR